MNLVKVIFLVTCFLVTCLAGAQSPPAGLGKTEDLSALVKKQFGSTFTVGAGGEAATVLVADFDGDGVPDVAIVADSKDPLPDSYESGRGSLLSATMATSGTPSPSKSATSTVAASPPAPTVNVDPNCFFTSAERSSVLPRPAGGDCAPAKQVTRKQVTRKMTFTRFMARV